MDLQQSSRDDRCLDAAPGDALDGRARGDGAVGIQKNAVGEIVAEGIYRRKLLGELECRARQVVEAFPEGDSLVDVQNTYGKADRLTGEQVRDSARSMAR